MPLTLRLTHAAKEESSSASEDSLRPAATFETSFLVTFMSPTAHQAQLLSSLITSISPTQSPTLHRTFKYIGQFLAAVAEPATHTPVLSWSVRAVSLSHLGRQVHDQNLIQLSRQTYRQALLTLNAALQDPISGLSSRTLAATILLSFYEVINATEKDSWIRHAGGAGHLMRLRGPDRHRSGLGRISFLAYRHSLVIEAFLSRNATFLAVAPWLELSRAVQKSMPERSALSDLVDDFHLLTVELPGWTQSARDANAGAVAKGKLLALGRVHRGNLMVLHERIVRTLEDTGMAPTEGLARTADEVVPVVYRFPSLVVGSLLCGYWAVLTVVNRNLEHLEAEIEDPVKAAGAAGGKAGRYHLRNTPSDGAKYAEENLRNARECCKSAEALTSSAFLGPLYLIFALRVAYNTFESGEEKEWVVDKLEEVSAHLGIAKAILDVQDEHSRQEDGSAGASTSGLSPEMSRSSRQSPQLKRKAGGMGLNLSQAEIGGSSVQVEDLSRRTSVSLQEIEGTRKGKGVLR